MSCTDTHGFDNGSGKTCADYAALWCKAGRFRPGAEWTGGAAFRHPERNCCACGKSSAWACTVEEDRRVAASVRTRQGAGRLELGFLIFAHGERHHSIARSAASCLQAAFGSGVRFQIGTTHELGCTPDQEAPAGEERRCWAELMRRKLQLARRAPYEVTILLDADVDTALRRIVTRGRDEERGISRDYLAALNAARESFFASVPHDKHRLDASRAPHEVAAAVSAIVASLVDGGWPSPLRIVGVPRGVVTYASCMARRSRPLAHAVTKPPARLQEHLAATRISACWRGFDDRQWGEILSLSRCLKHYQMELPVEPSVTVSVSTLRCPWSLMSYHASLSHLYRVFSCRAGTRRLHRPLERPERGPASGG